METPFIEPKMESKDFWLKLVALDKYCSLVVNAALASGVAVFKVSSHLWADQHDRFKVIIFLE